MDFEKKIQDELEMLNAIVSQQCELGATLYHAGQVQLADDLSGYAMKIAKTSNNLNKLIKDMIADKINQDFNLWHKIGTILTKPKI